MRLPLHQVFPRHQLEIGVYSNMQFYGQDFSLDDLFSFTFPYGKNKNGWIFVQLLGVTTIGMTKCCRFTRQKNRQRILNRLICHSN